MRRVVLIFAGLLLATVAQAQQGDAKTTEVADSWVGRDAADLLLQWPVDRGFYSYENEETGDTIYYWLFGIPAHQEAYNVADGGQQLVGMAHGAGQSSNQAPNTPIFMPTYRREVVDVPNQTQCEISFTANSQGVIVGYRYNGTKCRPFARSWGRPKKQK